VTLLNGWLRRIFDAGLRPFAGVDPIVVLAAISLVSSVGVLLLFKATSDQRRLAEVKRAVHACLFEIRLLRDDARAILRAQGEMLRHQLCYLRLGLVPLVLAVAVLLPAIAQLQFHYGYRGIEPGDEALVTVRLRAAAGAGARRPDARLAAPAGLTVTTPAVWLPALRELCWRVRAERPGDYDLGVYVGGETLSKSLHVSSSWVRRSPARVEAGFFNQLLYPAEDPLPDGGPVESIAVDYRDAEVSLLGWRTHWLVVFFALSVVFTFALKSPLRVVL
jgi:hypothetical protein